MSKFAVGDIVRILVPDYFPDTGFPPRPDIGRVVAVDFAPHEHNDVETLPDEFGATQWLTDLLPEQLATHGEATSL